MTRAWLLTLVACGDPAPCDDVAGACVALSVESATVTEIDHLELDVLYGEDHGTTTTTPGGGVATLPLETAIELELDGAGPQEVGIVAAGKLGGVTLGTGAAQATLAGGEHATLAIVLGPPGDCMAGGFYCGGDKLAGDPETLYQCNGGGVPLARGRCALGCIIRPAADDACRGAGGCVEASDYCGGNKVDGDPQTLYTCTAGVAANPRPCANGCVINPGDDDECR
ncbi:MAG TPA: hypothetical protein VIU61_10685 [Kofleriaceae bacterium]